MTKSCNRMDDGLMNGVTQKLRFTNAALFQLHKSDNNNNLIHDLQLVKMILYTVFKKLAFIFVPLVYT